jgi:hypothetical protein
MLSSPGPKENLSNRRPFAAANLCRTVPCGRSPACAASSSVSICARESGTSRGAFGAADKLIGATRGAEIIDSQTSAADRSWAAAPSSTFGAATDARSDTGASGDAGVSGDSSADPRSRNKGWVTTARPRRLPSQHACATGEPACRATAYASSSPPAPADPVVLLHSHQLAFRSLQERIEKSLGQVCISFPRGQVEHDGLAIDRNREIRPQVGN